MADAISITYLSGPDVEALALDDAEILAAIEASLVAQGQGGTVVEPRMHLMPGDGVNGHFNVLRGVVRAKDEGWAYAGVKVVGDFVDNYKQGLPSEMAMLNLFDPQTGIPKAVIDATAITEMRTGALTAIGAKHLAPSKPRVLGHIGARGTAYWNVRLLDRLFDFEEIRVHSRRKESREPFAERLSADLGKPVRATEDWESCLDGADILVEASRLNEPTPLFKSGWIKPGALVIPYGTMSTLELDVLDGIDKVVVDDRGQMRAGPFGALRPHINAGLIDEDGVHAELGEICAGAKPGRERAEETILFWHRGLPTSDIALGAALLRKAAEKGVGMTLPFA
ncbi:ornithine cyclodeaminase family protein [Marivibrio halodurans]|uniref:Ornithine cyclodeaminase family protein n=1 Tax=Marivibrio halodurans TaxID=2039722 RepID=A0A8J7S3G3_9PROT|nr:ornithine cyclodeaminase family protein [Marivibrio halodurans]MBP5855984.1 ornithine cyclodeaminase family protein [Marivibrio halodurans]